MVGTWEKRAVEELNKALHNLISLAPFHTVSSCIKHYLIKLPFSTLQGEYVDRGLEEGFPAGP